jgi:ketosteroid isomerase-like protein
LAARLPHDHRGTGAAVLQANRANYKGDLAMSEKEILGLEDKRFGAMIKGDFSELDAMVHEQLLYTHSSGNTDTKPSWLESMKSGRAKYKAVNCSDRKVRVFGDVALITGRAAIEAEIAGQPRSLKLLFLNAWTRTPQGWKFVAWQSTPLPT